MTANKQERNDIPSFPIDGADIPNSRFGHFTIRFTGATGLVGTAFGRPHTTATRISTGVYKVDHPASKIFKIWPSVHLPTQLLGSGAGFSVEVVNNSPTSGTFELHTYRPTPTGYAGRHGNPPAGGEIELLFFHTDLDKF